jgi:hypothetical protein
MLVAIGFRNMIELSGSEEDLWTKDAVLPKAFNLGKGSSLLWTTFSVSAYIAVPALALRTLPVRLRARTSSWRLVLISRCVVLVPHDFGVLLTGRATWIYALYACKLISARPSKRKYIVNALLTCYRAQPVLTVLASELMVDWLKHAFITKFNHIRPSVYERYTDVLCRDLGVSCASMRMRKHQYVDQSPVVARRLGFASSPLAILAVLVGSQSVGMIIANNERVGTGLSPLEDWLGWLWRVGPWVVLGLVAWLW